ncbi:MAG TPA: DUF2191 domain-containing protein [Vicinamibacteria bacterium]|nr:DUF2191 domain-containing protein [Vicinamibacteria bacterium]
MRTTVRIDDDLLLELKESSQQESLSLTALVNRLLRRGLQASRDDQRPTRRYRERALSMGRSTIDLDRALAVASALEDEELLRKLSLRK